MKAKYKQVERDFQINIWSHISQVSYYIQWCHEIKKWFYVNVHDTTIKLQCKKIIQSHRNTIKQSQVQFFIIFSTKNILTYLELCRLDWSLSRVLISIFWLNSSTWYQSSDSTQILNFNILIQSDIDLESILDSSSQLNSTRNWKWRQES